MTTASSSDRDNLIELLYSSTSSKTAEPHDLVSCSWSACGVGIGVPCKINTIKSGVSVSWNHPNRVRMAWAMQAADALLAVTPPAPKPPEPLNPDRITPAFAERVKLLTPVSPAIPPATSAASFWCSHPSVPLTYPGYMLGMGCYSTFYHSVLTSGASFTCQLAMADPHSEGHIYSDWSRNRRYHWL